MLQLASGRVFRGTRFGANLESYGEVVFTTSMVSCELSLTDPSYAGQVLVFTFPLVANTGIPSEELDEWKLEKNFESSRIHAAGVIVLEACDHGTRFPKTLHTWLVEQNVPGLFGVHTRQLTELLRDQGNTFGVICDDHKSSEWLEEQQTMHSETNWVKKVSCKVPRDLGPVISSRRYLVIDCGIKNSILRELLAKETMLRIIPYNAVLWHELSRGDYDGLIISNGPGDPRMLTKLIQNIRQIMQFWCGPILGICLGHQLLALAAGASVYKMTFGNRGLNQSIVDLRDGSCFVTSQNHGYAVENIPESWIPIFQNANDKTNEGIMHTEHNWMGVQFHPEANPGPHDTRFLFAEFMGRKHVTRLCTLGTHTIRKVLLLGSGGLSIGQAGEFDYSGAQAIKAMQEENIEVVLINPNIATVQSVPRTYYYPITPEFVIKVIELEKPQGILLQFGGQTALNCGLQLREALKLNNVQVLGTSLDIILMTEDRAKFAQKMDQIGEHTIQSMTVDNLDQAVQAANTIGYPVLVRAGFTLGGLGSGFACNEVELRTLVKSSLQYSDHLIIDKSLYGFKEFEYEMVRDCESNCIAVCNMENMDPVGIHTGDSIVVAPSQTLTNAEYFAMRETAVKVVNALNIVGECNIQFAKHPVSSEFFIIEVNARLSRSSALASKATGYPLAYVAAKLALGKLLRNIPNPINSGETCAFFEPAMDYVVVKLPHWDFSKFCGVSRELGTAMKSVGEVMGIGCVFEEAFMKAMRMNGVGFFEDADWSEVKTDKRIQALFGALRAGQSVQELACATSIDVWFLQKLKNLVCLEENCKETLVSFPRNLGFSDLLLLNALVTDADSLLLRAKKLGFSDAQVGTLMNGKNISDMRRRMHIVPGSNPIDTSAGEFRAQSNYRYLSYHTGSHHFGETVKDNRPVIVLGCGTYRIGSSCEFDWCAVHTLRTLRANKTRCVMINHNPETVSTDFDECDVLYFEELSVETICEIYAREAGCGLIVSVGGQQPNTLALALQRAGLVILGSSPANIDLAENRFRFSELMDEHKIAQPAWQESMSEEQALAFSQSIGFPVLVRPSYVLSGSAMNVAYNASDLQKFLKMATDVSPDHPVVISKYFENAKELEYDAVASNGQIVNFAISEHVENAGTHSGDASLMIPAQKMYVGTLQKIRQCSAQIAKLLNVTGGFNVQYLCKNNKIFVIECNLRASRSFPFVSKALNINLIELATRAMVGLPVKPAKFVHLDHVCVKVSMFSYARLPGVDPVSGVEMAATGEVACFSKNANEAFLLAMMAAGFRYPKENNHILVTIGPQKQKQDFVESMQALLELGFQMYGTSGTVEFYSHYGVPMTEIGKEHDVDNKTKPVELIVNHLVDMVINIPDRSSADKTDEFKIRRAAIDNNVPLISNLQQAIMLVECFVERKGFDFSVQSAQDFF